MDTHDIPISGPVYLFLWSAVVWLNPLVHMAGLAVAIWAFRSCRKRGYLVVAIYFAVALFSLLAMPSINRAMDERRATEISQQTQEKVNAAIQQAVDRVLAEDGYPLLAAEQTVNFPFGPLILVAGLWLIARNDIREQPHQS